MMEVRFVNLGRQMCKIRPEIEKALGEVLDSTAFAHGPAALEFEKKFAEYLGIDHCLGCGSGTDALVMALRALGVGRGDEVIMPTNTFIATAEAVCLVGAKPVFTDHDASTYLMRASDVEKVLSKKTKAIIPVHLYGNPVMMDDILETARRYNLTVIEDAAQAHGASVNGIKAGTSGDVGCFSFYPSKNLGACGEAGAVVTNDSDIAERLRMIREHGSADRLIHEMIGFNSRMDGFQAAVLRVKLRYLDQWNESRRAIARQYFNELRDVEEISLPDQTSLNESVWHLFVIQVPNRDDVRNSLNDVGIQTGIHYPVPLHRQPVFSHMGYKTGDFPVADRRAPHLLSLPICPELTSAECAYVCAQLKQAIGATRG